jgi:hypothetical protein
LGRADPGLRALIFGPIFRGLKPPAPSVKANCKCIGGRECCSLRKGWLQLNQGAEVSCCLCKGELQR